MGRLEVDGTALASDKRHARCIRGGQGIGRGSEVDRECYQGEVLRWRWWMLKVEESRFEERYSGTGGLAGL